MLKHCRPDILARGHLSLLHRDLEQYILANLVEIWTKETYTYIASVSVLVNLRLIDLRMGGGQMG